GDLDVLVGGRDTGGGRPNFLFKNIVGSQNRWLAIRMIGDGVKVNRDAIGARVTIQDDERVFLREVRATRGMYNSMDTRVLHFGLGVLGCSYQIEARWPDGTTVSLDPQAVGMNRYVTLRYPDAIEIP
ncbi:MAG TPA: ASPIC/UnbV domain-containing protein, partial [Polyangiaceae bacterium]|nr:ASPIC/UnbV domain-containing protein [Polyangiaceae bacterium]